MYQLGVLNSTFLPMHFSPKETELLAAICRNQASSGEVSLDQLAKDLRVDKGYVSKIVAGINKKQENNTEQILIRNSHGQKAFFSLNSAIIVTTGLAARIILNLDRATRNAYINLDEFKKDTLKSKFFKKSGKDEGYIDRLLKWCLLENVGYAKEGPHSPDLISASKRAREEKDYLDLIAVPE